MRWLAHLIAGPTLWALVFSLVYGAHGWACAAQISPEGLGAAGRMMLVSLWVLGLIAFIPLLRIAPTGPHLRHKLPRAATWIGLGATVFTLFPVVAITSC